MLFEGTACGSVIQDRERLLLPFGRFLKVKDRSLRLGKYHEAFVYKLRHTCWTGLGQITRVAICKIVPHETFPTVKVGFCTH